MSRYSPTPRGGATDKHTLPLGGLAALLTAVALAVTPLYAQSPGEPQPIAGEQVGGTVLTVVPQVDYESAVLRVSGPEDYALTKRFAPGAHIAADLLAEAEAWTESVASPVPRRILVDGRYRYEVVFTNTDGESRVHTGLFFVEGGSAVPRGVKQAELRATRENLVSATSDTTSPGTYSQIGAEGFENNYVTIVDQFQDGTTSLTLQSFNNPPDGADWIFDNIHGDLRLRQYGGAGGSGYRMLIEDGGRVGIGTTTPLQELDIFSTDGADLRLSGSGADWILGINAGSNQFVVQDVITEANIFRVSQFAPNASLVIATTGVGVGTTVPAATLHVNGSGIIEGDVALGSSRTMKHKIESLDPAGVLAAIRELPIYLWKYRDDEAQASHIGPMAEDVHASFGIGRDDKHLSPADTAGLALAAIQGMDARLDRELEALRVQNTALADENHVLRQRLEAIERRIADSLLSKENP